MAYQMLRQAAGLAALAVVAASPAFAQQAGGTSTPPKHIPLQKTIGVPTPTGPVPSLAVMNAAGATLADGKLTLNGVAANTIVFADRPVRAAGHVTTEQFVMQWDEDKSSFALDPPNATVSALGGDGSEVHDAVVTLQKPTLDGSTLTFDVAVLEGNLDGASGPVALFIDPFAARFGGGGFVAGGDRGFVAAGDRGGVVAGGYRGGAYWHAPVYHGAWYGAGVGAVAAGAAVTGAAIGAAAASSAQCGYYPYPPC